MAEKININSYNNDLGLLKNPIAVILPGLVNVFGIFLFKQFMESIPDSLIESAKIDGCKMGREDYCAQCFDGYYLRNNYFHIFSQIIFSLVFYLLFEIYFLCF